MNTILYKKAFQFIIGLACFSIIAVPQPASAQSFKSKKTWFLKGAGGPNLNEDWTIDKTIADLIDQAKSGSFIYISIAGFNNSKSLIIPSLNKAIKERGVHVYLLSGQKRENKFIEMAHDALHKLEEAFTKHSIQMKGNKYFRIGSEVFSMLEEAFTKDFKSTIRSFRNAHPILKTNNINHNKFILFEELDGQLKEGGRVKGKWIVAQSSANWTIGALRRPQDLVLISDKNLYSAYLHYYLLMFDNAHKIIDLDTISTQRPDFKPIWRDTTAGLTAYFGPMDQSKDPVLKILKSLQCNNQATIRIAMSGWNGKDNLDPEIKSDDDRGVRIAKLLKKKMIQGCNVQVLAYHSGKHKGYDFMIRKNIPVGRSSTHTKFMLIEGILKNNFFEPNAEGQKFRKIVLTGSSNWNNNAFYLDSDPTAETILIIDGDSNTYQQYKDYWSWMCENEAWDKKFNLDCNPGNLMSTTR
jgi:phosphatidylserine/phosphatidylglycerophosphate/cardiolipin synthase-like enzyme